MSENENHQFDPNGVVNFTNSLLDPRLTEVLQSDVGIQSLFEMQEVVLRYILKTDARGQMSDVLLCAPTGSGKTLAYALPIIQALLGRPTRKLRAIVVVPTRDLAQQVSGVFHLLTKSLDIFVAVASGSVTMVDQSKSIKDAEVLVATPGRLEHLMETEKNMHLEDLKYLVLDESDRLLEDAHLGWIKTLVSKLENKSETNNKSSSGTEDTRSKFSGLLALAIQPEISSRTGALFSGTSRENVRKILVSATQTSNPRHLHGLDLRHPTFFEPKAIPRTEANGSSIEATNSHFQVPHSLVEEAWVVQDLQDKPTGLMAIFGWLMSSEEERTVRTNILSEGTKLVFTKSVEAAHRLCRLLEICAFTLNREVTILEMSGELSREQRETVINIITTTKSSKENCDLIVICSDLFSRGMDMVTVDAVINYDAPVHIQTYLHRAGRTARAGRRGVASTLLHAKQAHHFKALVQLANRSSRNVIIKDLNLDTTIEESSSNLLHTALRSLRQVLLWETLGLLSVHEPIPKYILYELSSMNSTQDDVSMKTSLQVNYQANNDESQNFTTHRNQDNNFVGMDEEETPTTAERKDFSSILVAQIGRNLLGKHY